MPEPVEAPSACASAGALGQGVWAAAAAAAAGGDDDAPAAAAPVPLPPRRTMPPEKLAYGEVVAIDGAGRSPTASARDAACRAERRRRRCVGAAAAAAAASPAGAAWLLLSFERRGEE